MILIIDNGSQYTHLIKRNCRDMGLEALILNARADAGELDSALGQGIGRVVLSGGPSSASTDPPNLCSLLCLRAKGNGGAIVPGREDPLPLLGICYGHQMIAHVFGGEVGRGGSAEYGTGSVVVDDEDGILKGMPARFTAWVSHFDEVKRLPPAFKPLAHSDICAIEAMRHESLPIFGLQFHPEVWHTEGGQNILRNFLLG